MGRFVYRDGGCGLMPSTMIAKGDEIVMILERQPHPVNRYQYKLLATDRTGTLQKEVSQATNTGFKVVGMVSRDEHIVVITVP